MSSRVLEMIKLAQNLTYAQNVLDTFASGNMPARNKEEMIDRFVSSTGPQYSEDSDLVPALQSRLQDNVTLQNAIMRMVLGKDRTPPSINQNIQGDPNNWSGPEAWYQTTNSLAPELQNKLHDVMGKEKASLIHRLFNTDYARWMGKRATDSPQNVAAAIMGELARPGMQRDEARDLAIAINTMLSEREPQEDW